jgi:hypothetical protein
MAKRLATEFVQTCLQLSEAELSTLLKRMSEQHIVPKVKVLENGNQEIEIADRLHGEDVKITFERRTDAYVMSGGFRTTNLNLADLMRRTIIQCKGDAIVHRIYAGFTMAYHYARGSVARIEEWSGGTCRTVFKAGEAAARLAESLAKTDIEKEIAHIRHEINQLLDQRFATKDLVVKQHIDRRLAALTRRLFILEA